MKRRFYIELDEEYIPIFKVCGITAPFSDFKEQILCKDCERKAITNMPGAFWCKEHSTVVFKHNYCDRAKRKEE